jgi:hypothetical protein
MPGSDRFDPGKDPVPTIEVSGWAAGQVWTGVGRQNLLHPPRFKSRTVQPVVSRYIEYATRVPCKEIGT